MVCLGGRGNKLQIEGERRMREEITENGKTF